MLRIKSLLLDSAIMILLLALIVVAAAPSIPSVITPADDANLFNGVNLTCSGSTDADEDTINILFFTPAMNTSVYFILDGATVDGWYNNLNKSADWDGGDTYVMLDMSPGEKGWWGDAQGNARAICERGENENYYYVDIAQSWTSHKAFCENLNGTDPEGWHLAVVNSADENVLLADMCTDLNFCYIAGFQDDINNVRWMYNISANLTLQNSTSTTYAWSSFGQGSTNEWFCQACDDTGECSSPTDIRNVTYMNFTKCDSGNIALNISFYNESTPNSNISADIDSTFAFNSDDAGGYIFTYTNTSENSYYQFCLNPNDISISQNSNITYDAADFIQRSTGYSSSLIGNDVTELKLYLLDSNSGIYVTFQTVDAGTSPISGVLVDIDRVISGDQTNIAAGYTDAAGIITFWLDPTAAYIVTASKTGYSTFQQSITPTQSSYTITMGGGVDVSESYFYGITYDVLPKDPILTNNTVYNFTLSLNSSYWNLTSFGFNLVNSTGYILNSTIDTAAEGGTLILYLDTDNHTEITMNYFWNINGNFTNLTKTWNVRNTYQGELSIKTFFDDLKNFTAAGWDDFGLSILAIIIIVIVVISLAYAAGVYNPIGVATVVMILVWILEYLEFVPELAGRQFLLSVFVTAVWFAFFIQEVSR